MCIRDRADFYKVPLPSQMKESYELPLDGLEEGEYTASIVALDSWDAQSEPLTCTFHIGK